MHFLKNAPDTQDFSTVLNPAPPTGQDARGGEPNASTFAEGQP